MNRYCYRLGTATKCSGIQELEHKKTMQRTHTMPRTRRFYTYITTPVAQRPVSIPRLSSCDSKPPMQRSSQLGAAAQNVASALCHFLCNTMDAVDAAVLRGGAQWET